MSADNYYRVCKHPKGGFTAVMGFMSNDERPEPREDSPQFDTWQEAYAFADQDFIIEYGINVDPDCIEPPRCDCGLPAIEGSLCGDCLPTCRHGNLVARLQAFGRNCVEHGDMTPSGERALLSILGLT